MRSEEIIETTCRCQKTKTAYVIPTRYNLAPPKYRQQQQQQQQQQKQQQQQQQQQLPQQKLGTRRDSLPDKLGSNLGKLATRILEPFKRPKRLNLVVLGSPGCGKTSLVRRFAGDIFYDIPVEPWTNTFRTNTVVNERTEATTANGENNTATREYEVIVTETSRHRQSESAYRNHVKSGNAFLLVYSMDNFDSILHVAKVLTELRQLKKHRHPIVVVGNKSDAVVGSCGKTDFERHAEWCGLPLFRVSAKHNEGIADVFTELSIRHGVHQGHACVEY